MFGRMETKRIRSEWCDVFSAIYEWCDVNFKIGISIWNLKEWWWLRYSIDIFASLIIMKLDKVWTKLKVDFAGFTLWFCHLDLKVVYGGLEGFFHSYQNFDSGSILKKWDDSEEENPRNFPPVTAFYWSIQKKEKTPRVESRTCSPLFEKSAL